MTCLAGDVIGDYSFDRPLAIGDKLVFLDMAHYTMVKTTTFNGVRLPVDRDARSAANGSPCTAGSAIATTAIACRSQYAGVGMMIGAHRS